MPLKNWLKDILPENLLDMLPESFEEVGDIAILRLPADIRPFGSIVARELCRHRKNINTVLNRTTMISGDARIPGLEILLGEKTETIHREYGYSYHIDLAKVFFSTRLSYERNRIRSLVEAGESVIVLFAGAGPFAIPVAGMGAEVIAIDNNPHACSFCMENAAMNGVQKNLDVIRGDAFNIPLPAPETFDRAIVPAPYGMDNILDRISPFIKKGGMIHLYTFRKAHEIDALLRSYRNSGYEVILWRRCGNVAPAVSRYVFDLKKSFS